MTENTPARRLPVRLPPHSDELLSSWIGRHAAFYAVPPLVMLRHCLPGHIIDWKMRTVLFWRSKYLRRLSNIYRLPMYINCLFVHTKLNIIMQWEIMGEP